MAVLIFKQLLINKHKVMKKIMILCCSIMLFSCSNESSEINRTPENKNKRTSSEGYLEFEDYLKFISAETKIVY